jgi:hypothetical protein
MVGADGPETNKIKKLSMYFGVQSFDPCHNCVGGQERTMQLLHMNLVPIRLAALFLEC